MRDETAAVQRRAHRDADTLTEHLNRLVGSFIIPRTLVAGIRRRAAEQLVTWGWTHLGPGEQVTTKPTPRDGELSLRDELAATIAGAGGGTGPVALAEYLIGDGWVKLGPDEKVVTPLSPAESHELVQEALRHWEKLKKAAKQRRLVGAEVSADASELTSGVKLTTPATRILAIFTSCTGPLFPSEAIDMANGEHVDSMSPLDTAWRDWRDAFSALVEMKLLEPAYEPVREGMERRYQLTGAGRAWNNGATS